MARGTIVAASQMVWRTPEDVADGRQLFSKVVGEPPLDDRTWRNSVTWGAAVLIALSAEQSLATNKTPMTYKMLISPEATG